MLLQGCRLVHMCLQPGQRDEPHDHPKHYMYILAGGRLRITGAPMPAGETMEAEMPTGAGMVMPAGAQQVENIGDTEVQVLFLEVEEQTGPSSPQAAARQRVWWGGAESHIGPQQTDPDHYATLAEDEDWMVVKMDLGPGEEDHPHSHREHVVFALSEAELTIWGGTDKTGEGMTMPIGPGAVLPVPVGFHIVANTGKTHASCVYFERKQ